MDKDKILDYVMNTPHNTNRAILEDMLDSMGGSGESEVKITIIVGENSNLYLSEEDISFLQSLPPAYNISQYNIHVYLNTGDIKFLGLLATAMNNTGQPTNYLYTGTVSIGFYNNTFNKSAYNCFMIDTSNGYSVTRVN